MAEVAPTKPQRFGRYLLLDRINAGGMAEVFRGKAFGVAGFQKIIAIKRILKNISADEDFIRMFIDEAKLTVELQHANIVHVFDLGHVDSQYFIAMEYVSGLDLRTIWDRARRRRRLLPIALSAYVVQRICEGLDYAHRKKDAQGRELGLVHRDVSPQNILISYEGEVKVVDFGIAVLSQRLSRHREGALRGKFGYMSPEQVRGFALDRRSDIFSCGTLFWELLVGDRLFAAESDFATLERVRAAEIIPPTALNPKLSPELERIVLRALAKDRSDRYAHASEMAEDLQRYLISSNQPFARTDLVRYLLQHFDAEIHAERGRIDGYLQMPLDDSADTVVVSRIDNLEPWEAPHNAPERDVTNDAPLPAHPLPAVSKVAAEAAPIDTTHGTGAVDARFDSPASSEDEHAPGSSPRASSAAPTWFKVAALACLTLAVAAAGAVLVQKKWPNDLGAISITVEPPDASIFVNDTRVDCKSPCVVDALAPGRYIVRAALEGFRESIEHVSVEAGMTAPRHMTLRPNDQP